MKIDLLRCNIIKKGPIITKNSLIFKFSKDSICNPCVFKTPKFLKRYKQKWIMLFSHHYGREIRVATTNNLDSKWSVKFKPLFKLDDIKFPESYNANHIASPDVVINNDVLRIYFHAPCGDEQFTFSAETKDGYNFKYDLNPVGMFYFRNFVFNGIRYGVAKYRNDGGVVYKYIENSWVEYGRILPRMRHCCIYQNSNKTWIAWSEIGDCPEKIYVAEFNPETKEIKEQNILIDLTEDWEGSALKPRISKPGQATGVPELRDPFIIEDSQQLYLFYTYRGEEGIALAKVLNDRI